MTKKEMEKLADIITKKLIESELFSNTHAQEIDNDHEFLHFNSLFPDLTQEELLIGELARLQTILMMYEGQDTRDGYLKAAKILRKLRLIQEQLGGM
jgi:hypothetical protein